MCYLLKITLLPSENSNLHGDVLSTEDNIILPSESTAILKGMCYLLKITLFFQVKIKILMDMCFLLKITLFYHY